MRNLASKKYGLDMLQPHLPSATLEQVFWEGGREGGWVGGGGGGGEERHAYVNWVCVVTLHTQCLIGGGQCVPYPPPPPPPNLSTFIVVN